MTLKSKIQTPAPDLLARFANHKVAANLLMILMIISGLFALSKLNSQFLPSFNIDVITVRVAWRGASADDVERAITQLLEQELRNLSDVKDMTSVSTNGLSVVTLSYHDGSDMGLALDQVTETVATVRNLPSSAEKPEISKIVNYEPLSRLLLVGAGDLDELRHWAYHFEESLLDFGIDKVRIEGLPKQEVSIQLDSQSLQQLGLSLSDVSGRINAYSQDSPAGLVGREEVPQQLRALSQGRDELAFADVPLQADNKGQLLRLGDIAEIEKRDRNGQTHLYYQGKPAIELTISRALNSDALTKARLVQTWLEETRPQLPQGLQLHLYDESWKYIEGRINLLVKNGLGGLVLVILVLYIFLSGKVAWWVTVGIPVCLLATQAMLLAFGGSINMVSLFAMIMALGVIVDDAIVVGEDAMTHYQYGESPLQAAEGGARRMLAPVFASSLTTISAFVPLMMIGGIMGTILFDIPLIMVCVIIVSLIEVFLVLPGHLNHSFAKMHHKPESKLRQKLDKGFDYLRDSLFRPLITIALKLRAITVSLLIACLILGIGLLLGKRIQFEFFPTPEPSLLYANVSFTAGTPAHKVDAYLAHLRETLAQTDKELQSDKSLVLTALTKQGKGMASDGRSSRSGEQFGSLIIELDAPDNREVRNPEFIKHWEAKIKPVAGLESFTITARRGGPPGQDIDIRLSGADALTLKQAALELKTELATHEGVSAIEDDLPYGREQLIYTLSPIAVAAGLSHSDVSRQLRAAFDGELVQIYLDGRDEIEVRVALSDKQRDYNHSLEQFELKLANGDSIPLHSALETRYQPGFDALRHYQGKLTVQVVGNVDRAVNNSGEILAKLKKGFLPELAARYNISYQYEGLAARQAETFSDMKRGVLIALASIYIILAWVFSSYGWPLVVMSVIPFGLIGAIMGHWLMGMNMSLISLFGFFALSGIVVNDSIVLVTFYRYQREKGIAVAEALVEASCQRLRAVLLTSLTTIGGLLPILFETSRQAQFLIPMAVSLIFGLAFATVLVLILVPTLLSFYENWIARQH